MTACPAGWARTTLGEIGLYLNGRAFKRSEWSDSGRPIIRIQNLTGSVASHNYYSGPIEERYIVRNGDLLISWAATLGAFVWRGPEGVLNQHIFKVHSFIDKRFHYYLVSYLLAELKRQTHGSGMVHVTRSRFGQTPVNLPPLAEQRRIVFALEDHLSRIDRGIDQLSGLIRRIDHFRDALMVAVGTGRLERSGVDMVEADISPANSVDGDLPEIPFRWRWARLGEIAEVVGGVTKDSKKQSDPALPEVPYLRVANVQRGRLDLTDVACIRVPPRKAEQLELRPGDVLLNEGGDRDKLGRGWVWEGQIARCIHQNHVFRARILQDLLHPKLLAWHANGFGKRWCEVNGKQSVNLASISLSKIKLLPVPVPPQKDQERLVVAAEQYLSLLDSVEQMARTALHRADKLRKSLLAEAFSGRLVEQCSTDEPASILLIRIQKERATQ